MKLLRMTLGAALVAMVGACDAAPTGVVGDRSGAAASLHGNGAGGVIESAKGAGSYTLGGLDLDGDGVDDPIDQVLGFNAKRFADGSVRGQIEYHQSFLDFSIKLHARVTCMEIYDGNRVKFGGVITKSTDASIEPGLFIWFQAIDNGEGAAADPDLATGSGFGDEQANEAFCASPNAPNPRFLSEVRGNVQVDDGS